VSVEIRAPNDEELRAAMVAANVAFGSELNESDYERERKTLPTERALVAFDRGGAVGLAGAYAFDLTIPGGELPCAGVTWVGVMPTHRRRGILRDFMRKQLEDAHGWGEPIAALWASESSIYGRFGYGQAAPGIRLELDSASLRFRDDPGQAGSWRLVDADEAATLLPPVYERFRRGRSGLLSRNDHWWRGHRLADPEHWRRGASPKFTTLLELDGDVAAYAIYRVKEEWDAGFPKGTVRVLEAFATSAASERELWRYLAGVDLTSTVDVFAFDPGSPLPLMVLEPRRLTRRVGDGLWLRLVDVDAALRARAYAADDSVVLRVRDELCPWNDGTYRAGVEAGRTDDPADLELDVADLASPFLGAFDFIALQRADRVRELREGAVARASALFRTDLPPYCPEVF
jgi:predicted acetyltransferase